MRVMNLGWAIALALAASCTARAGGDDNDTIDAGPPATASLTVTPANATLNVVDGAPVNQVYTVTAIAADGTSTDVTSMATLSVDANFGSATGSTFTTTGTSAGVTTITANVGEQTATTQLTVHVQSHRLDTGAVANAADLFGPTATVDPDPTRAPTIAYPAPDVTMPSNIGDFDVHWRSTSLDDTFEIEISSPYAVLDVFEPTSPNYMEFTPDEWNIVSSQTTAVTINVRSALSTAPGTISAAPTQTATLSDQPIAGGLYYWAAASTDGNNPEGIYRHDVGTPGTPPERFYTTIETTDPTSYPNGRCVACHALSRDGTKMSISYDGGGGPSTLMDVATRTPLPSPGNWDFASYTAMGDYVVTESVGGLTLRDSTTAAIIGTVPTGGLATHPDFSAIGDSMTYVQYLGGGPPWGFTGGEIYTIPYDDSTQTFGTPQLILDDSSGNNYYPSFSPDGQWIIFNRDPADGSAYNNPAAEVWVVPAAGGTPIQLLSADATSGLTDSWARWAPFQQTVGGEAMYWVTFSSTRDFGTRLVGGDDHPQVWMTPFFPDRATASMDPSGPAFRLPFQNITSDNHIAQWADQVIPIQ